MKNVEKNAQSASLSVEKTACFADLGISDSILEALKKLNLDTPTPIQSKTIPVAIEGKDLIGVAQTGTGKTFAFGIPMLQRLGALKGQGLILTPTRELAQQIEESLKKIGGPFGLRTAVLIGGDSFDRQSFLIRKKPHVIIATPGRILDHLKRKTLKLDLVNTLVLDEADMMLDMGFAPQINDILAQAPEKRQTMLFSATMPAAIVKIAAKYMKMPVSIEVARPGTTAADIDQEIFIMKNEDRFKYLEKLLKEHDGSVLVFVRTKHGVMDLNKKLKSLGHKSVEIHSNLSLAKRRASLNSFKSKKERILVATDVAARGLDINNIELVINYNLPDSTDDYVHRIGRTGRAGLKGKAISFATPNQIRDIRDIEKLINKTLKLTPFTEFSERKKEENRNSFKGPRQRKGLSLHNRFKANRNRENNSYSRESRAYSRSDSEPRSYMNPKFFGPPIDVNDKRSGYKRRGFSSKQNFKKQDDIEILESFDGGLKSTKSDFNRHGNSSFDRRTRPAGRYSHFSDGSKKYRSTSRSYSRASEQPQTGARRSRFHSVSGSHRKSRHN